MRSIYVLILLFGVGCGVASAGGGGTEEVSQAALPTSPGCTPTTITQFQAATQIAIAACESLGEDGNALCMAPIVASYCPDPRACQALVCDEQMETISRCGDGLEDAATCLALFVSPEVVTLSAAAYTIEPSTSVVRGVNPVSVRALSAANFMMTLPLRAGDRIQSVAISHRGDGVADLTTYGVAMTFANGTTEGLGAGHVVNPPAFWTSTPLDVEDTTLPPGASLTLHVGGLHVSAIDLGNVTVTYERP